MGNSRPLKALACFNHYCRLILLPALILFGAVSYAASSENIYTTQNTSSLKLCVTNLSATELLFVLRFDDGTRDVRRLENSAQMCLTSNTANQAGTVAVFEDFYALEGCTKLANAGQHKQLLAYAGFDNCTWSDQDEVL